jgi:hypothetical protein
VKAYPQFRSTYSHEEMAEHFPLTPAELQLVLTRRGGANRCGMALLLKTISHPGYVPDPKPQIPEQVRAFVAAQLGLLWDSSDAYTWHRSTLDYHLAQIRQHSTWRFPTAQDKADLENWLRIQGAKEAHTADALFDSTCERLRSLRKPESSINSNKTNDMKNNEVPEGESDNPKGDPDDETSGEDTLETDGGGEALEGTSDPSKE